MDKAPTSPGVGGVGSSNLPVPTIDLLRRSLTIQSYRGTCHPAPTVASVIWSVGAFPSDFPSCGNAAFT